MHRLLTTIQLYGTKCHKILLNQTKSLFNEQYSFVSIVSASVSQCNARLLLWLYEFSIGNSWTCRCHRCSVYSLCFSNHHNSTPYHTMPHRAMPFKSTRMLPFATIKMLILTRCKCMHREFNAATVCVLQYDNIIKQTESNAIEAKAPHHEFANTGIWKASENMGTNFNNTVHSATQWRI